jgi:hypothetical protein
LACKIFFLQHQQLARFARVSQRIGDAFIEQTCTMPMEVFAVELVGCYLCLHQTWFYLSGFWDGLRDQVTGTPFF